MHFAVKRCPLCAENERKFFLVSSAVKHNCSITFGQEYAKVMQKGDCIVKANKVGDLYMFHGNQINCYAAVKADDVLWHKRYGHLNVNSLKVLINKEMVSGFENMLFNDNMNCKTCML